VPPLTEEAPQLFDGFGGWLGLGVGRPDFGKQHLKLAGPGHSPVTVFPDSHALTSLQVPPAVPQTGLVQHWTFTGSWGQNPGVDVPPLAPQEAVVTQTPGVPLAMEHAPFSAACAVVARKRTRAEMAR
jgi:hypothetical protein